MMEDYMPRNWDEFAAWMQNFAEQLSRLSVKYGISTATLTSSPGSFRVAPLVATRAEQIEVRCIYLRKNNLVGNYSDIKTAFIAP